MARPGDDELALAEADACALGAVLVPELGEALVDLLPLSYKRGVVALGKGMQNLTPLIGEALDLLLDFEQTWHQFKKRIGTSVVIPASLKLRRALSSAYLLGCLDKHPRRGRELTVCMPGHADDSGWNSVAELDDGNRLVGEDRP